MSLVNIFIVDAGFFEDEGPVIQKRVDENPKLPYNSTKKLAHKQIGRTPLCNVYTQITKYLKLYDYKIQIQKKNLLL